MYYIECRLFNTPPHFCRTLTEPIGQQHPTTQFVEHLLSQSDSSKGGVPGDLPTKLIKEFGPEISAPVAQICRAISRTGKWPKRWRTEQGLALKKIPNPLTEDDARIISLTPFFSKLFEKVVLKWLLEYISDKLD